MTLKEEIVMCLSRVLKRDIITEDYNKDPVNEFDMDSILIMEFVIEIEEKFHITFSDFSALSEHMDSLDDIIEYFADLIERTE